MSSVDFGIIGRQLKKNNPGRWDENTDEEVGVVAVKKGLWTSANIDSADVDVIIGSPIEIDLTHTSHPLALNTHPVGFLKSRIKHLDKAIEHIGRQADLHMAAEKARFRHDHHQQELERHHRSELMAYAVAMLTARQQAELLQLATAHQMDTPSYLAWRVSVLALEINLKQLEETKRIEADNTERLGQIELKKLEEQKRIEFEHEQKMFHAKVGSAVDYANTLHLVWMRKNEDLKRLFRQVDDVDKDTELSAEARKRTIARIQKQIEKLEAELDGPSGQTVSADSGQDA
jgi:hypothetical protein